MKKKSTMFLEKKGTSEFSNFHEKMENDPYSNLMGSYKFEGNANDRDKWQILSKELAQKQEMIHRMMKEIDEKTDAIKITVKIVKRYIL